MTYLSPRATRAQRARFAAVRPNIETIYHDANLRDLALHGAALAIEDPYVEAELMGDWREASAQAERAHAAWYGAEYARNTPTPSVAARIRAAFHF